MCRKSWGGLRGVVRLGSHGIQSSVLFIYLFIFWLSRLKWDVNTPIWWNIWHFSGFVNPAGRGRLVFQIEHYDRLHALWTLVHEVATVALGVGQRCGHLVPQPGTFCSWCSPPLQLILSITWRNFSWVSIYAHYHQAACCKVGHFFLILVNLNFCSVA